MTKRKYVLVDLVVRDRFLAETRIEHQRVRTESAGEGVVGTANQHVIAIAAREHFVGSRRVEGDAGRRSENQIRGLLKNLGLVIGRAKRNVFAVRAAELTEDRPELAGAIEPLLKAREAIERQIADLDRKVMRLARNVAQVRQFMTAPGVGPIRLFAFLRRSMTRLASGGREASEPMSD